MLINLVVAITPINFQLLASFSVQCMANQMQTLNPDVVQQSRGQMQGGGGEQDGDGKSGDQPVGMIQDPRHLESSKTFSDLDLD